MNRKKAAEELFESIPNIRKLFKGIRGDKSHHHQAMVLHRINHDSGNTMKYYADKMHIAKSNFTKIIDSLIEEGVIERKDDPKDRRKINLVITEKGKNKVREDHMRLISRIETRIDVLDDEEIQTLLDSLKNIGIIANKLNQGDDKDA